MAAAPSTVTSTPAVATPSRTFATDAHALTRTGTRAYELPPVASVVTPATLIGVGLVVDHHDADGHPESRDGLLVTEIDREAGPIVVLEGRRPHYLEAQFANVQRDAVLLARTGTRTDHRPDGTAFYVPFGYGALKMSEASERYVRRKQEEQGRQRALEERLGR